MHLGDAEALRDLVLCELDEEPEVDDFPLAVVEAAERSVQVGTGLGPAELGVGYGQIGLEPPHTSGDRFHRDLDADTCSGCELGDRRLATRLRTSFDGEQVETCPKLLYRLRKPDRGRPVAEVVADLTRDEGARVRAERNSPLRLEPPDRLEQTHRSLLDEVVDLPVVRRMATRDAANEAEVLGHERLERITVVVLAHGGDEPGVPRPGIAVSRVRSTVGAGRRR